MLPQIGQSLHTSTNGAALSLTVYMLPFALVQLVSGTLGERWGRRRTVLVAYGVYLVASLAAALSPNLGAFLTMRGVLGVANAFTSPLLLAGLVDMVPRHRLSRSVGLFASCQAAGQSFAPLVGGFAAVSSWRWSFVAVALVAGLLALAPPPGEARPGAQAPRWGALLNARLALLAAAGFASYLGAASLPFLVALYAQEHLHARPDVTGLALLGFGVAGMATGAAWGMVVDRNGARWCGAAAALITAGCVAAVGTTGSMPALALCWTAAGAAAALLNVALQSLTASAVPTNRGGALSVVFAFRFGGAALAPLILLPFYQVHAVLAFVIAASTLFIAVLALIALPGDRPDPHAARPMP